MTASCRLGVSCDGLENFVSSCAVELKLLAVTNAEARSARSSSVGRTRVIDRETTSAVSSRCLTRSAITHSFVYSYTFAGDEAETL